MVKKGFYEQVVRVFKKTSCSAMNKQHKGVLELSIYAETNHGV